MSNTAAETGWDFVVSDATGRPALVAVVSGRTDARRGWAAKLRRNLVSHGAPPPADLLILVTPQWAFVWEGEAAASSDDVEPTATLDMEPLLKPYYERSGVEIGRADGAVFELSIGSWLRDLTLMGVAADAPRSALESSWARVRNAVHDGSVRFSPAA